VRERVYTSAANRTRRISESKTVAKVEWEADKCSKHHGYRLKGKAGSKRPTPMSSVKPLAAKFYRLKSGHAPVGTYLKQFGHRDNNNAGGAAADTGRRPRRGYISAATAADGTTRPKRSGKR
jgi:hypothetical protein